ncbi:sodium-independent sulfate anion transporter-like isoform X2 [Anthonomus grandis grandis]|uniref:sodium-independent sulfate anion transporter-like isoform X2 n=1 Tax=Anthonomus grandis grandis TaxID=2921223 RepID=UPI002165B330|nr:sodium-independent sulfate anion transporter-like isoform X2 [Anthonomus grandis grandis]
MKETVEMGELLTKPPLQRRKVSVEEAENGHPVRQTPQATITKRLKSRLPILTWIPNYSFAFFLQDLLAGFTVGCTEIPQGIAYAIVAGLPTQYGLYSGIMGGCMYFIFGTCKDINMGPTAIMALFVQSSVTLMGPAGAVLMTFLSGLFIFCAGILRLGFLVEFFSFPVISGFTTAAAISIACSQLKQLLGIKGPANEFLAAWESLFKNIGQTRKWDAVLGFSTIAALFMFREIKRFGSLQNKPEWSRNRNLLGKCIFFLSLAGNALAVIAGTSVAYVADQYYNATPVILTGAVESGLPNMSLPPFSTTWNGTYFSFKDMISDYNTLIVFCPLVAFLEHIAIVKAFTKGKIIDATQELIALGIGNMAGSLVHSMPITGSFTRTAVNNASGVKTTTAGLITSCMLMVSLALLTGVFKYIPKATLAGVIMVSMYYLCEFHAIGVMWRTKRLDLIPFFATLICSLLLSLEYGIIIGIAANLVFVLYDSARPKLYIETTVFQDRTVYIVQPKVALYFTCSEYLREHILKKCPGENTVVVIDGEFVRNIDGTVAKSFGHLLDDLDIRKQKLIFWNFSKPVTDICTGDNKKLIEHFKSGALEAVLDGRMRKVTLTSIHSGNGLT